MATTQPPKLIAYYRVSTKAQGASGLGLEAQREAVSAYASRINGIVIRSYQEIESGKRNDRKELEKACADAKKTGATIIVAKLDRLTRDTAFLLRFVDQQINVGFCDLPEIPPNHIGRFMLTMLAAVAELERGYISQRTREALRACKARGEPLGSARPGARRFVGGANPRAAAAAAASNRDRADTAHADVRDDVATWVRDGLTYSECARKLNAAGHPTRQGKQWSHVQIARLFRRSGGDDAPRADPG